MKCNRCKTNAFIRGECYACGYAGEQAVIEKTREIVVMMPVEKPKQLSFLEYAPYIERSLAALREQR